MASNPVIVYFRIQVQTVFNGDLTSELSTKLLLDKKTEKSDLAVAFVENDSVAEFEEMVEYYTNYEKNLVQRYLQS